mgnify:CR=1 FL=1
MKQQCTQAPGFFSEDSRRQRVDCMGNIGLAFGKVDCRIRCRVDDDVRPDFTQQMPEFPRLCKVESGTVKSSQRAEDAQRLPELMTKLPASPKQQNVQFNEIGRAHV